MSKVSEYIPLIGEYPAQPILKLKVTAQRATSLPNVGWKRRWIVAVTNETQEPISDYLYALDIGLTNGLVSGARALASGNDLRVWNNGREVPRVLVDWNSATDSTLIWVTITSLNVGETDFFDVVHFNTAAGSPPALSPGIDAPAFDYVSIGANRSTNNKWIYASAEIAANAGLGIWGLSSGTAQPSPSFRLAGAWSPILSVPNEDSRVQPPSISYEDSGTKYIAKFLTKRGRYGNTAIGAEQGGDGVFLHAPVGIASIRTNFLFSNAAIKDGSSVPIGKLVIAARRHKSEKWVPVYENDTLGANQVIAVNTYAMPTGTKDVLLSVWPYNNFVTDSTARADAIVEAKTDTILEINLQSGGIVQSIYQTETEVYELAEELRYRGGYTKVPPYTSFQIGNVLEASGAGTPRAAVELNNNVVINTPNRTVQIWSSDETAFVERLSENSFSAYDVSFDKNGLAQPLLADSWLEIRPTSVEIANPDGTTDNSGWVLLTPDTYVSTGSILRTASTGPDAIAGRFELDVSTWVGNVNLSADTLAQADNTAVASWTDASGNNRHAANAVGTEQPTFQTNEINGKPVIRFDGVDNDLTITAHGLTKPCTIILVSKAITGNAANDRLFHSSNMYASVGGTGTNDFIMDGGQPFQYSTDTYDLNTHIHNYVFVASGNSEGGFDGVVNAGNAGIAAPSGNMILSSTGTASWYAQDLAEFHAFNGAMSLLTRQKLDRIFADKYALTANLPVDHPYKNASLTAADGVFAKAVATDYLLVDDNGTVWFSADLHTQSLSVIPTLAILFYDSNQTLIKEDILGTWRPNAINTWYRVVHAAKAPPLARYWRIGIYASGIGFAQVKTILWDRVRIMGPDIILYDPSRGTIELSYEVAARYSGA